jgi:peptide/nickel transport system permease protein
MAIPTLIMALVVLSVLPSTLVTLILVMGILDSTRVYRLSRAIAVDIEVMDFVEAAKLRGEGILWIIFREILPNAVAPIINVVMLNLAYLVVGVVVIEVIFVYPGMGQYLVDHVAKRDVPVVQAVGLIFAAVYITLNIIADVASIIANPRLRHPK